MLPGCWLLGTHGHTCRISHTFASEVWALFDAALVISKGITLQGNVLWVTSLLPALVCLMRQ